MKGGDFCSIAAGRSSDRSFLGPPFQVGHVLVAVDRTSSPALVRAAAIAEEGNGRLTVLACTGEPRPLTWCDPTGLALPECEPEDCGRFVQRILGEVPRAVPVTGFLRRGPTFRAIREEVLVRNYRTLVLSTDDRRLLGPIVPELQDCMIIE